MTLLIETVTLSPHPRTHPNEGPVTKVVDCAEEPELVEEKIGSCHDALVWRGQRKTQKHPDKSHLLIKSIQIHIKIQVHMFLKA